MIPPPRPPWHHGRLGALVALAVLVVLLLAFDALQGPRVVTCVELPRAGIMCTTDHPDERRP